MPRVVLQRRSQIQRSTKETEHSSRKPECRCSRERRPNRFAHLPIPQDGCKPVPRRAFVSGRERNTTPHPGVCRGGFVLGSSPIQRALSRRPAISGPSALSAAQPPLMVEREEMNHHGSPSAETKNSDG
jgi:hypothetical protein